MTPRNPIKVFHVVGARPNYMKIAPVIRAMNSFPNDFDQHLVHTGQHYDRAMSDVFFADLSMPGPSWNLNVGSGTHGQQTGRIIERFEGLLLAELPDLVLVPGDVNSTVACALAASKAGVQVGHIEAGLRSFERSMPEEVNRIVTDHISDWLFVTEASGCDNLLAEGIAAGRIFFIGNTMIDSLISVLPAAEVLWQTQRATLGLRDREYLLVTLHRPSNVDDVAHLSEIVHALEQIAKSAAVVLPLHPRTKRRLDQSDLTEKLGRCQLLPALGYCEFLGLEAHAGAVLTDSGGVQEETSYLGVPCLTLRQSTERPVTLTLGTNRLVSLGEADLPGLVLRALDHHERGAVLPVPLWDGGAAGRLVKVLLSEFSAMDAATEERGPGR
jgi:UDP-N-acetylglucosamine 2-epimerase (non-hydrolysing)